MGPRSIDRFTDNLNCKLPRFNSKYWVDVPGTENVVCVVCDWKHENNYACPQVSLISGTIFHTKNFRATGTMILPAWHSAPFWPLIYSFKDKTFDSFYYRIHGDSKQERQSHSWEILKIIWLVQDLDFRIMVIRINFNI